MFPSCVIVALLVVPYCGELKEGVGIKGGIEEINLTLLLRQVRAGNIKAKKKTRKKTRTKTRKSCTSACFLARVLFCVDAFLYECVFSCVFACFRGRVRVFFLAWFLSFFYKFPAQYFAFSPRRLAMSYH